MRTIVLAARVCLFVVLLAIAPVVGSAQETESPLLETGPYTVGTRTLVLTDTNRDDRMLEGYLWYPALDNEERPLPPDASGAPYPLVIYSHYYDGAPSEQVNTFVNHLVSHGFAVAAVNHRDTSSGLGGNKFARPLDILFLLNALADPAVTPLPDLIDTDRVGLVGASSGAYTVLAGGGARVDFGQYQEYCETNPPDECDDFFGELEVLARHDATLEREPDESLWPPTTDARIRAVAALAPCDVRLFGERGLAELVVPTLLIASNADEICPYEANARYTMDHIGAEDRFLITLDNYTHFASMTTIDLARHMLTALFGLYLQGKAEYRQYLAPEWAELYPGASLEARVGGAAS